jgi:hypothetical protein
MSPPYAPGGEGVKMIATNNNYPRGNDNVNHVRPHLPDTQQSAMEKGVVEAAIKLTKRKAVTAAGG